jgi:hypothetical protein
MGNALQLEGAIDGAIARSLTSTVLHEASKITLGQTVS